MKDMKKIFIVLSLLALTNLGFLSARQDLHASAVWSAKRNARSFPAVQAAAITAQGATITGQVVDARTFQPLRGAVVSAASVPGTKPNAPANIGFRTGVDGKFILRGVAPGIVNFHVVKAGYTSGPFTSVRPAVDGERIDNVVLTVPPGASLSGRVVDEAGQPVAGMEVAVSSSSDPSAFVRAQSVRRATARTDDDGQYLAGRTAGRRVHNRRRRVQRISQDRLDRQRTRRQLRCRRTGACRTGQGRPDDRGGADRGRSRGSDARHVHRGGANRHQHRHNRRPGRGRARHRHPACDRRSETNRKKHRVANDQNRPKRQVSVPERATGILQSRCGRAADHRRGE